MPDCVKCGNCCDGTGWTKFSPAEALALGNQADELEQCHHTHTGVYYRTRHGLCSFFDTTTRLCGIYNERPSQCRTFAPGSEQAKARGCKA